MILFGFMGGTYYLVPEEAETDIYSTTLANVQLVLFTLIGVAAITGYIFGWSWGMPFLEQPTVLKLGIVVVALMFLFNIFMTMMKTKKWTVIQGVLLGGLVMLAGMFLFGVFFMKNLATQYFWWWWVIHLWVEGAWELVTGAIMAFMLMKITGVERQQVEKWLYVEVGLVLFTGIVGTGHHYYWIGTPEYWLWWGGIFSALEPLPILFMVIDTMRVVRERKIEITNRIAMNWAVGCAIMHFFGAGVWGFAHTLPQINQWTHGTQVTASHGHFAFFGAYAMLNLTMMYFAMPQLRGVTTFDQDLGRKAFWFMNFFMILIALALGIAGIVQVYFQRVLGMDFLTAQGFMKLWYAVFWVSAWGFAAGVVMFLIDFFRLARAKA